MAKIYNKNLLEIDKIMQNKKVAFLIIINHNNTNFSYRFSQKIIGLSLGHLFGDLSNVCS